MACLPAYRCRKSRDNERRLEQKKFLKDKKAGRRKDW
jgi:hypothetical protein